MALDAASAQVRLTALDAALDAFVAGGMVQSYTADGVTITVANFAEMRRYRAELRQQVARSKVHDLQLADLGGG